MCRKSLTKQQQHRKKKRRYCAVQCTWFHAFHVYLKTKNCSSFGMNFKENVVVNGLKIDISCIEYSIIQIYSIQLSDYCNEPQAVWKNTPANTEMMWKTKVYFVYELLFRTFARKEKNKNDGINQKSSIFFFHCCLQNINLREKNKTLWNGIANNLFSPNEKNQRKKKDWNLSMRK